MTLCAKSVLKDKFWVVEQEGVRVGTIQAVPDGVVFVDTGGRRSARYPSIRVLGQETKIKIERSSVSSARPRAQGDVYGFPIDTVRAYNTLYNVVHHAPVYTKTAKSKSMYCAGYYLILQDDVWTESFCPKMITINRYPFQGPFYSREEMLAARENSDV